MAEQQDPDPSAAIGLAENLKAFESDPFGDDGFSDVLKDVKDLVAEAEKEVVDPGQATPVEKETPSKAEEAAPVEEEEAPADDDFDFEDALSEEKPTEETPEEAPEEMPKDLSKKGQADWKALHAAKQEVRNELKATKAEKDALAAELAELRKQVAELPDLREKVKFVDEAEKELAVTRVEATREYKETVTAPLSAIEAQALLIAKDNDISTDKLFDAMAEPDPAKRRALLKAVTEDMDAADSADIFQMAKDTQALLARRAAIHDKAAEAAKELQSSEKARTEAEAAKQKKEFSEAAANVVEQLKARVPFMELTEGETAEDMFGQVATKLASTDFSALDTHTKALAVASRLMIPRLLKQHAALSKEVETLKNRLTRKNSSRPSVGSNAVGDDRGDDFGGDIEAAVANALNLTESRNILDILKEGG